MSEFADKRVVITGAAGALAGAVARRFAAAGARLALLDVAMDKGRVPVEGNHLFLAADLRDAKAASEAVGKVLAALGRVDVLCNIAGGYDGGPAVHQTPLDRWRRMIDMNATTLLNMVSATVPAMLAQKSGKIVNVGAMAALGGKAGNGAYVASKAAVIRLTESMAAELRASGINVNCVLPSIIDTPANRAAMPKADFSKWVSPEALADVIAFLASDAARAVHGAAIPVAGLS